MNKSETIPTVIAAQEVKKWVERARAAGIVSLGLYLLIMGSIPFGALANTIVLGVAFSASIFFIFISHREIERLEKTYDL